MWESFTCTTPDEGWGLYRRLLGSHLGNYLSLLVVLGEDLCNNQTEVAKLRTGLLGNLVTIAWQMEKNGHEKVSADMGEIIELVLKPEIIDEDARVAIHQKHREVDPKVPVFEQALADLEVKYRYTE